MFRPAFFALTCRAAPVLAQDVDCADTSVQMGLNHCAEQDWQAVDLDLNRTCKAVTAAMKALDQSVPSELRGAADTLRDAQRARISCRDANRRLAGYPMRCGSAEPLLI